MNLSKKVFLVIAPVVTLFFVVATTFAYNQQKTQILKLENNRLKLALTELSTLHSQYSSFSEGYLNAVVQSNSLKQYLQANTNRFQRVALVRNIEYYLRDFRKHKSNVLSLTISQKNPKKAVTEYIEISENPFTTISDELKSFSFSILEDPSIHQPALLSIENKYLLAFSTLIDPDTIEPPLATRADYAYSITFAIEPTEFINELRRYESDFSIQIKITESYPQSGFERTAIAKLGNQRYLVAELSEQDISKRLLPTLFKLIFMALIFMCSCALIIFLLVSKLIIAPINLLGERVKHTSFDEGEAFDTSGFTKDEVGSLASEFNKMFEKLARSYEHTNELVQTDHLTKQANLYQITKIFQDKLVLAQKAEESIAFLYLDLDNFKFVNDRYGHDIGDKVLVAFSDEVVKLLKSRLPLQQNGSKTWAFGRIAGDEFGIIITNSPPTLLIDEIVSKILALFHGGFKFLTGQYPISVSVGVVLYPRDGDTPSQLISNADKAMYQSKRLGKNRVSFYSEQIAYKIRRDLEIENELKNASFDNEFYLVFLPIVHTQDLSIYGFETLLRWNSPRLGFVSPAEFIPIAEACGFFEAIDSWVVQHSFSNYNRIKEILNRDFILSINLSSAQITINKIHAEIFNLAESHDIPKEQVQFEMTETTGAEFFKGLDSLLTKITDAGFKLAIDDFGSGYTSLQQLVEYPANDIKFDKSFLDATMSGGGRQILKPLVQMCHAQEMAVTVEGIETREQYEYMRSINVDHLQGFLFSQPVTLEELPGALITLEKTCSRLV